MKNILYTLGIGALLYLAFVDVENNKEETKRRFKRYETLEYEENDGIWSVLTAEGVTVMLCKNKKSLWYIQAFRDDVHSKSPHGYPSLKSAQGDAIKHIEKVLYPTYVSPEPGDKQ